MNDCYDFVLYEDGPTTALWTKNQVEATYVIYLEGNKERYEQVVEQLSKIRPTETVWILHNKGYKKCNKPSVKLPPQDLVDANYTIFEHANAAGYKNILVLEDDFLFDERLLHDIDQEKPQEKIGKFIEEWNIVTPFIPLAYYLGTLPMLQCPIEWYHNILFFTCGSHAIIYNTALRNNILLIPREYVKDWDIYTNQWYSGMRYTYRIPLCYQLFPNTTNSNYWGYQNPILEWLSKRFHELNSNWLQLDTKIEPGYSFYNLFSKILFFVLLVLIIYLLSIIFYWFSFLVFLLSYKPSMK